MGLKRAIERTWQLKMHFGLFKLAVQRKIRARGEFSTSRAKSPVFWHAFVNGLAAPTLLFAKVPEYLNYDALASVRGTWTSVGEMIGRHYGEPRR